MAHTPGPWKVKEARWACCPGIISDNRRIATCLYDGGSEDPEVDANACLIALAPELLEKLEQAHKVMGELDEGNDHDELWFDIYSLIARAKGDSHA